MKVRTTTGQPKRYLAAHAKHEQMMRAFAPLEVGPCRTNIPDPMPWERPGLVLRPPPPPVDHDHMPPLSRAEFLRILRWLAFDPASKCVEPPDPANRRAGRIRRRVPLTTLANACGSTKVQIRRFIGGTERASEAVVSRMSPLLRRIDAGLVECVRVPGGRGDSWELRDVLDPKVHQK